MQVLNKTSVPLSEETLNYLQQLEYEVEGYKVLHTHALNSGVSDDRLKVVHDQFQDKFNEYQLAKNEVFQTYGKDHLNCKRWWVDFLEGVMYFVE